MPKLVNDEVVMSSFDTLYAVDCSGMTEKKTVGGANLTYLSWSDAWALIMKLYPDASYEFVSWEQTLYPIFCSIQYRKKAATIHS